jgi:hypothetical protein
MWKLQYSKVELDFEETALRSGRQEETASPHWQLVVEKSHGLPRPLVERRCPQHMHLLVSAYTSRTSSSFSPALSPLLVAAVEACVYHAPAADCVILYVSKIDFACNGFAPSPTATLVRTFIRCHRCYANPATSSGRYTTSLGTALLARKRLVFLCQLE